MPGDGIDDVHNLVLPGIGGGKFSGRLVKGGGGDGIDTALSGSIKHPNGSFFTGTFLSGTEYMDTYGRHTDPPRAVRHGNGKLMLPNGDYFEGCFINGGVCGEGKFTSKASGVSFSGKFGRRRNPQHDAPNTFELEDTMIYRGLSTAKGLMPLKLFEESKTLEAPSAAPSAGAAAAVEAAPSADSDDDLAAVRGSLKPRPPRKKKAKSEGEDEEHQQPVYAHSMILTGTHHTQQASKQAAQGPPSFSHTLTADTPLSLHTTISLIQETALSNIRMAVSGRASLKTACL